MRREVVRLFQKLVSRKRDTFAVGIDWMKPFWLAAELHGNELTIRKMKYISEINDYYSQADAVLIDIPIGLPENGEEVNLRPDREARELLPTKRKPSIFPVPCRQAIRMEDYTQASAENERVLGSKLTSQSYGFSKMIRQVDDFLAEDTCWKNRLVESHPEVAFQMLNGGKGLQYSKHTEEGIQERVSILCSCGVDPAPLFAGFKPKQYEDVLDAVCLAVTAKLGCENEFMSIPANPVCDSRGLKMQMALGKANR